MEQLDLSYFFTTKAQANDFSSRLSIISEKIYKTGFDLENLLVEEFGIKKKEKFITLLRENNIHTRSTTELKSFIALILEKISKLPVLTLTIAFEPKEKTLKAFSEWFILNLNKQILLNINIDHSLLAGAAIAFQGKFADFSIRQQFETVFKNVITNKTPQDQKKPPPSENLHQDIENISLGR